jgi:hypothetical protein
MSPIPVGIGIPLEQKKFIERHHAFMQKLQPLTDTLHKVFIREAQTVHPADRVVFFLGRLCVEDFMEILLLCGNGYGIGGLKLLRSLYEGAVTAGYIAENPAEAETFLDYYPIERRRYLNHAKMIPNTSNLFPPGGVQEIESSYKKVRDKFRVPLCKKCGTTKLQPSWSKLDLKSMALKVTEGLENLYLLWYYEPTLHAHPTVSAVVERMIKRNDDGCSFNEGPQRDHADKAVMGAHHIILYVLLVQNRHFKLNLDEEIGERFADFKAVWR